MIEKNLDPREGWINRHLTPLPQEKCVIKIINKDVDGEHELLCQWTPECLIPGPNLSKGYLGTAKVIQGEFVGFGYHVWQSNDWEFVYYQIIK